MGMSLNRMWRKSLFGNSPGPVPSIEDGVIEDGEREEIVNMHNK